MKKRRIQRSPIPPIESLPFEERIELRNGVGRVYRPGVLLGRGLAPPCFWEHPSGKHGYAATLGLAEKALRDVDSLPPLERIADSLEFLVQGLNSLRELLSDRLPSQTSQKQRLAMKEAMKKLEIEDERTFRKHATAIGFDPNNPAHQARFKPDTHLWEDSDIRRMRRSIKKARQRENLVRMNRAAKRKRQAK